MTDTDITALVERLRLAVQRLTIDISDAGMAADALEALQAERLRVRFIVGDDGVARPLINSDLLAHAEKAEAEIGQLREALEEIDRWGAAYPLKIFPEPDLKKAHALLQAGGMTLDAISASSMRHVIDGVAKIARTALAGDKP